MHISIEASEPVMRKIKLGLYGFVIYNSLIFYMYSHYQTSQELEWLLQ